MLVSNSWFLGTHGTFSRNTRQKKVHNNKLQSALFICHHLWQTLMAWTRTSHLPSGSTAPSKCLDTFSSRGGAIAAITGEIMTKPHQTLTPICAAPLYISDTLLKVCDWKQLLKRPHTHTKIPLLREGTQKKRKPQTRALLTSIGRAGARQAYSKPSTPFHNAQQRACSCERV